MSRTVPSHVGWLAGVALLTTLFAGTGLLLSAGPETDVTRLEGHAPNAPRGSSNADALREFVVVLDLDGDGRKDEARFRGADELNADWEVTATLADGGRLTTTLPLVYSVTAWPVDINDDGREELVVRQGGNTWTAGTLLVLAGGELQPARGADGPVSIGWGAHSNCCPGGTADVACGPAAGGVPRLVITTSQLVSPAWDGSWPVIDDQPFAAYAARPRRRAWDREVYRLDGATLVKLSSDRGVIVGDDPEPVDLPLRNALDCDAARD